MQKKKGISLIVLIITIIVMIVLAGAIILSLSNNGIINKASDAVQKADNATLQEIATLGWTDAYANAIEKGVSQNEQLLLEELENGVKAALTKNNLNPQDYGYIITKSGVKIAKGWLQDGLTVRKYDTVLTIGDTIDYDETANGKVTVPTNVDWQVLGASDNGELLILSSKGVARLQLGDSTLVDFKKSQNDWLTGAAQMDALCEPYRYGENAVNARSITEKDVDRIVGYNKSKWDVTSSGKYGESVTYYYNGTTTPAYKATNKLEGNMTQEHTTGFHYYDGNEFRVGELKTTTGEITTLVNSYYESDASKEMDTKSDAYKMLFEGDESYWLATPYVRCQANRVRFGMYLVRNGMIGGRRLWRSDGTCDGSLDDMKVRAVVVLSSDVQI